jgi:hypothetical protein
LIDVNIYLGKSDELSPKEVNIGKKAVLTLYEPYFNTKRIYALMIFLAQFLFAKNYGLEESNMLVHRIKIKLKSPKLFEKIQTYLKRAPYLLLNKS